jgi:hypothetical protein
MGVGMHGEIVDVEAGNERAVTQRTRAGEEGRLRQGDRLGIGRPEAQQQAQQDERERETPPHRADHRQASDPGDRS